MFEKKIRAIIIIEMLGRPKEHIISVMNQLVERIGTEKGIKILNSKVHDAKIFENKDQEGKIIHEGEDLFTTFAEVEMETNTLIDLLGICFQYMPANVEVIEPEEFKFKSLDFNSMLNEILRRLHNYDSIAKSALMNNQLLGEQIRKMQGDNNQQITKKPSSSSKKPAKGKKAKKK